MMVDTLKIMGMIFMNCVTQGASVVGMMIASIAALIAVIVFWTLPVWVWFAAAEPLLGGNGYSIPLFVPMVAILVWGFSILMYKAIEKKIAANDARYRPPVDHNEFGKIFDVDQYAYDRKVLSEKKEQSKLKIKAIEDGGDHILMEIKRFGKVVNAKHCLSHTDPHWSVDDKRYDQISELLEDHGMGAKK